MLKQLFPINKRDNFLKRSERMRLKIVTLFFLFVLAIPVTSHAQMKEDNGDFYFYNPKYGFIVKLITPKERNITSNIIDRIDFELLWYDYKNPYQRRDPIRYARAIRPSYLHVYYKNNLAMSDMDQKMILLDNGSSTYTIRDYDTQKDKSGPVKINIAIENLISPISNSNKNPDVYYGDGSSSGTKKNLVSIDIELNYFNNDKEGGKFYTNFTSGKAKMFENRLTLDFPKDTYINDPGMSQLLPEQDILVKVNPRPDNTEEYMFISQSYKISDKYERNNTKPSQGGNITLQYDSGLSPDVAMHNVSIVQHKDGKWIPIGGVVDSKNRTVTAPIEEFGEYAAVIMYKTYKLDAINNWAKPYVLALAYKGVIQPDIYLHDGRLLNDLNAKITRFDFIMMLARARGLKPVPYNGYFSDVSNSTYGKAVRGYDGTGYLMSAVRNGFVQGKTASYAGNIMEPEKPLTREEAAVFLARAMNVKIPTYTDLTKSRTTIKKDYRDFASISDWAVPYVEAITKEKLMQGNNRLFKPHDKLTVAEASTLVYNMMTKMNLFGK
jgi:hypothetical protein